MGHDRFNTLQVDPSEFQKLQPGQDTEAPIVAIFRERVNGAMIDVGAIALVSSAKLTD